MTRVSKKHRALVSVAFSSDEALARLARLRSDGMLMSAVGVDFTRMQHVRYSDASVEATGSKVVGDPEVQWALESLMLNGYANSTMVRARVRPGYRWNDSI